MALEAWVLSAVVICAGCSATRLEGKQQQHPVLVSAPVRLGEGDTGKAPVTPEEKASRSQPDPSSESSHPQGWLPDPQPLALTEQWEFVLRHAEGTVTVEDFKKRVFQTPVVTSRRMGRFAFELWIGRELVDRVRFDFPLLGAETPVGARQGLHEAPRFAPGLDATRTVLIPNSPRATRAQIVDRATETIYPVPWPPDAPLGRGTSGTAAKESETDYSPMEVVPPEPGESGKN